MRGIRVLMVAGALVGATAFVRPAQAQEATTVRLTLKQHRFDPAEVRAPAGKPIEIVLKNLDASPAEFESKTLKVEKVVAGGAEVTIKIRAQKPGRYAFFDEYNEATAQGALIVE
jgi:hypothetical protein